MSNPISGLFNGASSLDKTALDKAKRKTAERSEDLASADSGKSAKAAAPRGDELVLSDIAQKAMAEPAFDRSKVEAIKQALKDGNYPLNARRIAESFVSMEKLIG